MCGRYRLKDPKRAFAWLEVVPSSDFLPRFNIAPTQRIPVVAAAGRLEAMTWGILPAWGKSKALINARSETIREKRSFKSAFTQRRCLLPADGFYEWSRIGKRPHLFTLRDDAPFAIAGIWEAGEELPRCCLLTTMANSILAPIHDRMPVIVRREDWPEWLTPAELPDPSFRRITAPYPPGEMTALPVSRLVNSARVDDSRCCDPVAPGQPPATVKIRRKEAAEPDAQQTFGF
jgi:putative SOS response-associated peptidase YedK